MTSAPHAAPSVVFDHGRPGLVAGFLAARHGRRRYGELAPVAAVAPGRSASRIQYWTFGDVTELTARDGGAEAPVSYDITVMSDRPMGWERCKTHGHVHVERGRPGLSYPEVYEVLGGRAGFLVQDLGPGPSSAFCSLIEAVEGQVVVVPPGLHHVTINLGTEPLVIGDLICRMSDDAYDAIRAAHGMAYYVATDGRCVPNPHYRDVPPLARVAARDWAAASRGSLYARLRTGTPLVEWLCEASGEVRDPGGGSPFGGSSEALRRAAELLRG